VPSVKRPVVATPSLFDHADLPVSAHVLAAVETMAASGGEERGAIFTRRSVVEFMLDLAGYTVARPLHRQRLLEPSFGGGDFLLPAVDRLLQCWRRDRVEGDAVGSLSPCIRAVELHHATFLRMRAAVLELLCRDGVSASDASAIVANWLVQGDFLLAALPDGFDVVIGNPPYVRQERVDDALMAAYRSRYSTLYDRADLYVPFIERSLSLLRPGGHLAFICADRWMKNRYGGPLRQMVAAGFHLKIYVDMVDTPAFHSDVIAYPAITVIARQPAGATRIAHRPALDPDSLAALAEALTAPKLLAVATVRELAGVTNGAEPWVLESSDQLVIVRRLELDFPTLEEAGCKVGIGVATGADHIFIAPFDALDVEPDRKLPLVMTRDIRGGTVQWQGLGVINPFAPDGGLVRLERYPRLQRYLMQHKAEIAARHCAQKAPDNWYRTIDRIYPELAARPKLLIPDIKGGAHIVLEAGTLYPHHNLYFITSDQWDLKALQAVLRSGIARLFVAAYSTRMRGGYLRFQAQYLRRIRIPRWQQIPDPLKQALVAAAERDDVAACNRLVFELYGLSSAEREALGGNGDYDILCQKLAREQLYTTASVIASPRSAATTGDFDDLSEMTSLRTFVTSFAGHIAAAAARSSNAAQ
jgi:Eco57I restriction-modification methylase/TaqI-like C-terminal specificity domain